MPERIGAVILAAGAGRRMGHRPKPLLQREGEPLLLRQIRLLQQAGVAQTVVVLGHHAQQLQPLLAQAALQVPLLTTALNPAPDDGPASSLRCGLLALAPELSGTLVVLADQPLLQASDVQAVIDAWQARPPGTDLVLPVHEGSPGHPLVLGAQVRSTILQGQSVRDWRHAHPTQVQLLHAGHARYTTDVDSPDALEQLAQQHGVRLSWPP